MTDVRIPWRLAAVSCLTLLAELVVIRWLSTEVRVFAYARNIALLLCFLGFGVGCALSSRRVQSWGAIQALFGLILLVRLPWLIPLFEGLSENLGAGQDIAIWYTRPARNWPDFLLAALVAGILFFLLTSIFIPLGQIVSSELDRAKNRLTAYTWNLAASLLGIGLFFLLSWLTLPPAVWFTLILLGFAALQQGARRVAGLVLVAAAALLLYDRGTPERFRIWTPYQEIDVENQRFPSGDWKMARLRVNHVSYQDVVDLSPAFLSRHPEILREPADENPYNLPFRFTVPNPSVLVVGAGAGNDVAGAVRNQSRSVDAVEIDPVILKLGRSHPEKPYAAPTVTSHLTDARAFMKRAGRHYDLILFGLLDSHTQHSDYANLRIDNYVYTAESLREARHLLSPDGVLFLKFQVNRPWLGRRLYDLITLIFGKPPRVFLAESSYSLGAACFVISPSAQVENRLQQDSRLSSFVNRHELDLATVPSVPLATDDWPYLYQQKRSIPAVFLTLSILVIALALFHLRRIGWGGRSPAFLFFFAMGAGFLLLETQAVSRLALYFGTTWQVNGIVIGSVLTALVAANFVVERRGENCGRWATLAGLLLSLVLLYFFPVGRIPGSTRVVGSVVAMLFAVPVLFAGVLFAREFRGTVSPSAALAANMLGAVIGGLAENVSLVVGLRALILVALAFYALAGLGLRSARA